VHETVTSVNNYHNDRHVSEKNWEEPLPNNLQSTIEKKYIVIDRIEEING
jgi:hypothetical protein